MGVTGEPGSPPMRAGIAVADSSAGVLAATGILIALAERERSGLGQWVETSLLQAQIAMMDFQAARYLVEGVVPPQAGNDHPTSTPMGVVATEDGFINIGVGGDGQWRSFCEVIGRPDLANHPDYAKGASRTRHRPQIKALLGPIFAARKSADWLTALEAKGVPAGPIYKVDEVFADPQVQHLGIAAPLKDPERGDIRVVGQAIGLSRTPASIVSGVPEQGEHTQEILREIGYSDGEIAQLRASRIV
jgi:crotonobetainyl-CoA:carnitine CoA-transferase CaiB-like acyl-CoA transferase